MNPLRLSYYGINSITFNASFLVISKFVEKNFRFVYLIILARYLGPKNIGLYNFGIAFYLLFMPLVMWGMREFLGVVIGKEKKDYTEAIANTLFLRLITTVLGFTAFLSIGWLTSEDLQSLLLISIFAVALFGRSFAFYGRDLFIASERSHYSALSEVGFRLFEFVCGSLWLLLGGGLFGVCFIHAGAWVLEGITMLFCSKRKLSFHIIFPKYHEIAHIFVQCLPFALYMIFWMGFQHIGMVLLKNLANNEAYLGYYAVSFQLILNLILLPQVFSQAALPVLSRVQSRGSRENEVYLETVVKMSCLLSTLLIIFVLFFRHWCIELLFGSDYLPAANTLLIFSVCLLFLFVVPALDKIVLASQRKIQAVFINLFAFIFNVSLTIVLFSRFSFLSPALAMAISSIVLLVLNLMLIHFGIFRLKWWRMVLRPYLYSLFALGVALILIEHTWIGCISGVLALLILFVFGRVFSKEEIAYFRKLLPNAS